jgi:N-acetylglutamate synthase-like GNAT family acetyltransferase
MRKLPDRPDLDQLRHQARELQRAAAAGDGDAIRRLRAVSTRPTLSAAQLALAREHGYQSWAKLKAEVERRRAGDPGAYVIRPVTSLEELTSAFDLIRELATPSVTHEDRRFQELAGRFPEDRSLMLVVAAGNRIVGGMLGCRRGDGVSLRALALAPGVPEEGLMTRLLQSIELEATRLGASEVYEGGVRDRDLYERRGYRGRNPMVKRLLPLPGRARAALLRRLASG